MAGKFEGWVGHEQPGPDDDIVLYHNTSPENAARLREQGTAAGKPFKAPTTISDERFAQALGKKVGDTLDFEPGRGQGSGLYVTRHPAAGIQYGTAALPVRVKMRDLGVPPERASRPGMTPWRSLNVEDGYIPGPLSPDQFGDVYSSDDWREWNNHLG